VRRCVSLLLILCWATILRLWALDFGLPHSLARPDEGAVLAVAMRFFQGIGHPGFFDWPSLFMYAACAGYVVYFGIGRLAGWFSDATAFVASASTHPGPLLLVARTLSAACGVLTVWTTARVGTIAFDRPTGTLAAFFLAGAALHVRDSHFGVTDVAATCLLMQSFFYTVRYDRDRSRRDAVLSAIWAGLAASTKYNTGLVVLPGLWAIATRRGRASSGGRLVASGGYGSLALVAFVVGTPYAAIDAPTFLAALTGVFAHLRDGHGAMAGFGWIVHLRSSLWHGLGWPVLGMGLAGLVLAVAHKGRMGLLLTIFPVTYFASIGAGQTGFARYIIPSIPFLCLSAAHLVVEAARASTRAIGRPGWAMPIAWSLATLAAAPSVSSAILTNRLLARADSRLIAATWIHEQVPAATSIYQSGSVYGHVQLHTADPEGSDRVREVVYDEALGVFRHIGGAPAGLPELLVIVECPLFYCDVPERIRAVAESQYVRRHEVTAFDASRTPVYDWDDAFFVPLAGFAGVTRPGPNLTIFVRR